MTSGFLMLTRDRETRGIYVETVDDWQERMSDEQRRMIYCQAVSDVETVQQKVDQWVAENGEGVAQRQGDINDTIAEIVSSIQWIANEHPLHSFRRP